jgi:PAS domain S-box-containing protein
VEARTKKTKRLRQAVRKNFGQRKGGRSPPKRPHKASPELVSASALRAAVEDSVRTRLELASELTDMVRLHELSTRLSGSTALQPLLEEILKATMALLNADLGSVQLYDPHTKMLEFVAHRGFRQEFFDYFNHAPEGISACGLALKRGKRVIIEDVLTEAGFAPHLKIVAAAGFRAVQATPLFSRAGEMLGVISTYFRKPHRPSQRELRFVDLYARQAAEMIELRLTERALQASEARFRRYFELGVIGMGITSPSKGILEVNDELCRILGYSREELLTKTWAELTYPDDLPRDLANFDRVMAGEIEGYSLEKRWIRKDGQIINGIMAAKCHRRPDGTVDYFVGLLQDITTRKRTEEERNKLASLVENSNDFIGMSSLEGEVLYVNDAGRKTVGLNGEGGTSIFDYVMEEDRAFMAEEILTRVAKQGEWEGEMPMRHFQTGIPIPMHVNVFVIKEEGTGRPLALATISRDISERKETEQKLHETQAELAHVTRISTLGEIGASIAHEINQPLGAIVNNSNVCLKLIGRRGSEGKKREVLVDIANDALRASAIITRIRALTKRSPSEKTFFFVEDLIDEVLALAHQTANKAGVSIKKLVPARLRLRADRVQLQQMLLNLVMNGIQAMSATPEKKRTLTLRAKSQKLDGKPMITISVADCGPGFTPEAASRLFEPFFTTKSNGMGLGLAISRSIAEAHGGRLWAEPNACPGATFYCALPAKEAKKNRAPKGAKS